MLVEPGASPIVVPVGRRAERVLVAHLRLPRSPSLDEPEVGDHVADYTFEIDGRAPVTVPIRERFELSGPAGAWDWQDPFLAVAAGTSDRLDMRHGDWGDAGLRQTEIPYRTRETELFLWTWKSPHPDQRLAAISFELRGSRVLVAAVTLSNADEEPFVRDAALPVRVTLTGADNPAAAGDLSVEVDRGIATYVYPLPGRDMAAFLADPLKGWGEPPDLDSPHSYLRVAASPSATLTVATDDQALARLPWREVAATGSTEKDGVRVELVEPGRNWVARTVLDDATGKPVPCRVHFRSPEGVPVPAARPPRPRQLQHRHLARRRRRRRAARPDHLRLHRRHLPGLAAARRGDRRRRARLRVRAAAQRVAIAPGQRELELRLKRWTNMNAAGWSQRRHPRPLPLHPGRAHRGAGRGPERRQPAPVAVGQPVHQHRGVHRRADRLARRPDDRRTPARRTASTCSAT